MRDPHTKDPRGFAFVTMTNLEEAEACISALTSTELEGKVITVEKVKSALVHVNQVRLNMSRTMTGSPWPCPHAHPWYIPRSSQETCVEFPLFCLAIQCVVLIDPFNSW